MGLQDPKPIKKYNCTQTELYAICIIGLTSYRENITDFGNFKGYYNAAWGNTFEDQIEAAKQLKSQQQRGEPSETANIQMQEKGDECLVAWQRLKRHIADVQGWENLQKPKLEAAGQGYYEAAGKGNWEDLKELMDDGKTFITNNVGDLTANQNMPPAFQGQFNTLKGEFDTLYDTFTDAGQDAEEETKEKIDANNGIYDTLIGMFKDGQEIYRKDRPKQERFIFDHVLGIVRGSHGVTKTIDIVPLGREFFNRVVKNSDITNTGTVNLTVEEGDVPAPTGAGVIIAPTESTTRPEASKLVTVFNEEAIAAGQFTIRVMID